jgi:hypothetical protein
MFIKCLGRKMLSLLYMGMVMFGYEMQLSPVYEMCTCLRQDNL